MSNKNEGIQVHGLSTDELAQLSAAVTDPVRRSIIMDVLGPQGLSAATVIAESYAIANDASRELMGIEKQTGKTIGGVLRYMGGAAMQGVVRSDKLAIPNDTLDAPQRLIDQSPDVANFLGAVFSNVPRMDELRFGHKTRLAMEIVNALGFDNESQALVVLEQLESFFSCVSDVEIEISSGVNHRQVASIRRKLVVELNNLPQEQLNAIIDNILGWIEVVQDTVDAEDVSVEPVEIAADSTVAVVKENDPTKIENIDDTRKSEILRFASETGWTAEELLSLTVLLGYEYTGGANVDTRLALDKLDKLRLSDDELRIYKIVMGITDDSTIQLQTMPESQNGGDQSPPLERKRKRERNKRRGKRINHHK